MIETIQKSTYQHKYDFLPIVSNFKILKANQLEAAQYYVYLRKCILKEQQMIFPNERIGHHMHTMNENILVSIDHNLKKLDDMENGYIILTEEIVKEFAGYRNFLKLTRDVTLYPDEDYSESRLFWQENSRNGFAEFITDKMVKLEKYLEPFNSVSDTLLNLLMKCLTQWKKNQQIFAYQNSKGCADMLPMIQKFYSKYADILWGLRLKILVIISKRNSVQFDNSRYNNALGKVLQKISHQFSTLVVSSFLVTQQPPQALQVFTRFV